MDFLSSSWEKKQHKNYQDEDKKSAINKKINSQIKKPHLKMIPIKDKKYPLQKKKKKVKTK